MRSLKAGILCLALAPMFACGHQVVGWPVPDGGAPTVSSTTPLNDATSVARNAPVSATFSEAMSPSTVNGDSFLLEQGTTRISGTVILVGVTSVFTPDDLLAPDTLYRATITTQATDLAGNALEVDHVWSFTTGSEMDATAPWVTATNPQDGATDVAIDSAIVAVFSEAMDPLTVSTATFTLLDGTNPVAGTVIHVGVTALFVPTLPLDFQTLYTAMVTTGAKDLAGNAMAANHPWTFTTGEFVDTVAPRVIATNPITDATDVSVHASVIAVFSKVMAGATITSASFTVLDGTTPVSGIVSYVGVTATFTPDARLTGDTLYVATISNTVTDVAGNRMVADYSWSFTTGTGPDSSAPRVISTIPVMGATAMVLDLLISATFSEAMDPATITEGTFTLANGATPVSGVVTYAGLTAFFVPGVSLSPDTLYTATISDQTTDLVGNPLESEYTWTFTTGPAPDSLRPGVTFTVPADGANGVPLAASIAVVFSEPMDPATITSTTLVVRHLNQIVDGTVDYAGVTATFTPTALLATNTRYSASVTTAARDLRGNSLASTYAWTFRTGDTPDSTRPLLVFTNPQDGAVDVVLDTNVSATFNEMMDPLTLDTATFTLLDGIVPVAGNVILVGNTVSLDPDSDLSPETEYMATITVAATDLAGNALDVDFVWNFTTGLAPDVLAPTVLSTNPLDLEILVPLNAPVNATFSESMDPLTISTATFTVTGPGIAEVPGTVMYDALGLIGTFTPQRNLLPLTLYTATITTAARDLAGTPLLVDHVWTFSTGEDPLGLPLVNLGSLSTFVAVAGSGLTNTNSSGITILNGDVALNPTATCLGDGSPCSIVNPVINGTLYANDPEGVAARAVTDLTAAYVDAMARPVGTTVNDITGLVLPPGVYTSASTMSIAVGGTVTLDGRGDVNALWIFQVGSSLTVNNNAQILLINGAKARNVFWAVFASSTLGSNVSFQGSVLAGASNSVGTDSVVVGRLLCRTGQISLASNTITLPSN